MAIAARGWTGGLIAYAILHEEELFEWDAEKSACNRQLRGFELELVREFDFAAVLIVRDDRRDYGELRLRASGPGWQTRVNALLRRAVQKGDI